MTLTKPKITLSLVTIRGERKKEGSVNSENYFAQECYYGAFSRSYLLPIAVNSDKATANIKNGILTITIPKLEKTKTRIIKVENET